MMQSPAFHGAMADSPLPAVSLSPCDVEEKKGVRVASVSSPASPPFGLRAAVAAAIATFPERRRGLKDVSNSLVPIYINVAQLRRTLMSQPELLYEQTDFESTLDQYIRRHHDGTRYQLLSGMRQKGRLVVLLDGYHQLPEQARAKMDEQIAKYKGRLIIASRFEPAKHLLKEVDGRPRFRRLELPPLTAEQQEAVSYTHLTLPTTPYV